MSAARRTTSFFADISVGDTDNAKAAMHELQNREKVVPLHATPPLAPEGEIASKQATRQAGKQASNPTS